uniref:Gag-Pol polyprotein n=1 Tax=Tanacetum cinerariifolium TaxID=118510 RepID=A0A699GST9_TANCI|nr:hypothetical protein [Tanacetum cinerariifolium]
MMKGSDIGIQEKKAKLFNEWKRFTSNDGESIESYYHYFLKLMNDMKRNKHFPEKIARNLNGYNAIQNVGNQVIQNRAQNPRVQNIRNQNGLIGVSRNANQNLNGNGNLVAARAEGNAAGHNEDQYTELLEPIPESHQVPHNDNNVISEVTSVKQSGETVEQHPANFEETRALYDSLYQNLAIEVEKVNSVNRKLKETNAELTTELARFKNQEKLKHKMTLETHNWSSSAHQELHKIVKDENFPIVNQVDARVQNFEIQFLKEAAKFVGDFKSLTKEADESLANHKALELEIERLLRAVVSQDIMSVVQKASVVDTSNL